MQKHDLYPEALKLYQYDAAKLKAIMGLYAEWLGKNNKHKEAAIAYEYLEDHESAWPHYRSANLWQEALTSAKLAGCSENEVRSLAESLAEGGLSPIPIPYQTFRAPSPHDFN